VLQRRNNSNQSGGAFVGVLGKFELTGKSNVYRALLEAASFKDLLK
jgi:hypothetical protein